MTTATTNGSGRAQPQGARYSPPKHVVHATRGDETVLLDVRRGQYYTLNHVASRIWALLCEGESSTAIVERVCAEYDAPAERVEGDVASLLERLVRERLMECEPC
jgi:hypothetical protein